MNRALYTNDFKGRGFGPDMVMKIEEGGEGNGEATDHVLMLLTAA